jgi:hypothetical protein
MTLLLRHYLIGHLQDLASRFQLRAASAHAMRERGDAHSRQPCVDQCSQQIVVEPRDGSSRLAAADCEMLRTGEVPSGAHTVLSSVEMTE